MSKKQHPTEAILLRHALDDLSARRARHLDEHIGSCEKCKARYVATRQEIETLQVANIEPHSKDERRRRIAAVMTHNGVVPATRGSLPWLLAGGFATAVATVFILAIGVTHAPDTGTDPLLLSGSVRMGATLIEAGERLTSKLEIEIPENSAATISLPFAGRVDAAGGTRLTNQHDNGQRWYLSRGSAQFQIDLPSSDAFFAVSTPEATARVMGTMFTVSRQEERSVDRTSWRTMIRVRKGIVRVEQVGSHATHVLEAGQAVSIPSKSTLPKQKSKEPVEHEPTATRSKAPPRLNIADIRAKVKAGQLRRARVMIETARHSRDVSLGYAAELSIVEAETDLAEGAYGKAIARYLHLTQKYPDTPQAESALFAAAQLAIDHPSKGRDGMALLRMYLQRYPAGRFAKEAQLLLGVETQ